MRTVSTLAALCALGAVAAAAPPAPPAPAGKPAPAGNSADKLDAKALMQSGLKLFAAKDFLGALAVFRTAYARFPSARILLNIGTTLTRLDRKAEAANVYQHYLDAADADPARRAEVKKVLAELDAAVCVLELTVAPAGAELQVNDEDWLAAAGEPLHRVAAGVVTVRARRADYQPAEQTVTATAGARQSVTLRLAAIPPPAPVAPAAPVAAIATDTGVTATADDPARRRSRIGILALAHIDIANRGGAGLFGVTADVTDRLQAQLAAIIGPSSGGYAGASFALTGGTVRPIVAAGVPVFASHGARIAARGAGGVELAVTRHVAVVAELGIEYVFNPEADVKRTLFIPAIGATGRL
jgi:hypothetical protein